jgi:cytoskeleton protein RodZ
MGVFGDRMRREREMRGITLEEISESTKISKRSLQALEEEDFDLLPGGIFNRGFVRAYARFLGIDEEQAVADFVAAENPEPASEDKFPLILEDRKTQPPLNPKRSLVPVILALLLLAAVAGAWTLWNKHKAQHVANESQGSETSVPASQTPEQPRSDPPVNMNDPGAATSHGAEKLNSTQPDQNASSAPPAAGNDSDPSEPSASNDSTGKPNSAGDSSSADSTPVSKQAFTISVKATEDSWISIVADGKPKGEGILNAEKRRSVTAGKELVLVTGNAGGIEVSYNGKLIAPLGKKQQKRTVTFTAQGMKE